MNKKKLFFSQDFAIFLRYSLILILIYFFLTKFFLNSLMVSFTYICYLFLGLFTQVSLNFNTITLFSNVNFTIVPECIAPNAYMLITLIFFSIPVELKILVKIWLKSILWFSLFNLIRIMMLMFIHFKFGEIWFEKVHLIFYEFLSGVVVALIIIYYLRQEKIRKVFPVISDINYLIEIIKNKK